MARLALIGGGGFAKEIADVARRNGFTICGYFADRDGGSFGNYLGTPAQILERTDDFDAVALAIGAVNRRTLAVRRRFANWLSAHHLRCPPLISPHAVVADSAVIGPGTFIAHNAVVQIDAEIGPFGLINTAAQVGHDCKLGANVTISSLAFIGGGTQIGDDTLIGAGAKVLQGARVGADAIVGLGSIVLRRVADHATILPNMQTKQLPRVSLADDCAAIPDLNLDGRT